MKSKKIKNALGASISYKVNAKDTQIPLGVFAMSKKIYKKTKFKEAIRECFGDHVVLTQIANEYLTFIHELECLGKTCPKIRSLEEAINSIYNVRDVLLKLRKDANTIPILFTRRREDSKHSRSVTMTRGGKFICALIQDKEITRMFLKIGER